MSLDSQILTMLLTGLQETVFMVALFSLLSCLVGIPLGIPLIVTNKDGVRPSDIINTVLGIIINLMHSMPFIIMLLAALPLACFIVRAALNPKAVVVPLVLATAPYIARMVESSLEEVDAGVVEAARSMGASNFQVARKVMLPEAKPSLLMGAAISVTTILGYSTTASFVGGGGLDTLAVSYDYYRCQTDAMLMTVVVLVIIVQLIQESFLWMTWYADEHARWRNSLLPHRLWMIKQNENSGR